MGDLIVNVEKTMDYGEIYQLSIMIQLNFENILLTWKMLHLQSLIPPPKKIALDLKVQIVMGVNFIHGSLEFLK